MIKRKVLGAIGTTLWCLLTATVAHGSSYPEQPVNVVVGFAPGGGTDIVARLLATHLADSLGKPFRVENRPGAGAMIGAEYVARAAPNGYTLLLGTSAEMTISPPLYRRASYKPMEDFEPIALIGVSPAILVANLNYPGRTLHDVIRDAKAKPDSLSIGSGGAGTAPHLAGELLKTLADVRFELVPYKGAGPAQVDLIGGQIPLAFSTIASTLQDLKAGRVRGIAVISDKRSSVLPDVQSTAEQGLPEYQAVTWFGLFAPAGTPPAALTTLQQAVRSALNSADVKARLQGLGIDPADPAQGDTALRKRMQTELTRWTKIIHDGGIRAQ